MKRFFVFVFCIVLLSCQSGPQVSIEKSPVIPRQSGYIGKGSSEPVRYDHTSNFVIAPFYPVTYTAKYHIIAFFNGHPEYEAVEAFIYDAEIRENTPYIRAILTRHDNTQVDYVNFPYGERPDGESYQTDLFFEYRENGRGALLKFTDRHNDEYALVYVSENPVDSRWAGMTDVGGHSPDGGLPLFFRDKSGIAAEASYVRINKKIYPIPEDPAATHKPYFTGYLAYVSEGYNSIIYSTGKTEIPLSECTAEDTDEDIVVEYNRFENRYRLDHSRGVPEITEIQSRSSLYSPDRQVKMIFNPPFPNLDAMKTGSEASLRFQIDFDVSSEEIYGDIFIHKISENKCQIQFLPAYPGWAKDTRPMVYSIFRDDETVVVDAVMKK